MDDQYLPRHLPLPTTTQQTADAVHGGGQQQGVVKKEEEGEHGDDEDVGHQCHGKHKEVHRDIAEFQQQIPK